MAKKSKIDGMKELEKSIRKLGQVPQKSVTKAAKAGANISLKSARANAPVDTGDLKSGIVLKGEKRTTPGKKVYQVVFDRNKNHMFVKMSADGKRSYYPASQEYGYITRSGGYVPGYRFMRNSITTNEVEIEKKIVDVLSKDIDKALGKG
jgi:HK97 gp10 family phage protein